MLRWTTDNIRQSFLDFFKDKGHTVVPSAPLVPKGDPTLLFTNAGMVQFKDYFLGVRTPPWKRVVDCQKCLRISGKHNDLEAVGRDTYHHTFFEMLGNWSFGDYYKAEAIAFHWELVTKVWEIPKELLWATVYKDDDEAEEAWLKLKVLPKERILRCGEKDNFWEMGETGPCGPCSEIHIDRGVEASRDCPHPPSECGVNVDGCARYIELGNLVFIQYNRDASGKLTPLPMKHVEGAASALNSDARYGRNAAADVSFRAIADHVRAICFLAAEGVTPGNTDREYVLRRLIRRVIRHGHFLGIKGYFLARVSQGVIEAMGRAYPELAENEARIDFALEREWELFSGTLERGLELIEAERGRLEKAGVRVLPGEVAFKLYDTYGFPFDLTQDLLRDDEIGRAHV